MWNKVCGPYYNSKVSPLSEIPLSFEFLPKVSETIESDIRSSLEIILTEHIQLCSLNEVSPSPRTYGLNLE